MAERPSSWSSIRGVLSKARVNSQALLIVVRSSPATLIAPLLTFLLLAGVGSWAVSRSATQAMDLAQVNARSIAHSAADQFQGALLSAFSPVEVLASVVQRGPTYEQVDRRFKAMAPALTSTTPTSCIQTLLVAPAGVMRLVYPVEGNELYLGMDVFDASVNDTIILSAIQHSLADPTLAMGGPLPPLAGGPLTSRILVVRKSVYVEVDDPRETFGRPDKPNPVCGAACTYQLPANTTDASSTSATSDKGTLFWGFIAAIISMEDCPELLDASAHESPLRALTELGLRYTLTASGGVVVASSAVPPHDPVEAAVELPGTRWTLNVSNSSNTWMPAWFGGALAAVIVGSALAALLVFALMVSRRRHEMLLEALIPRELIRGLHNEHVGQTLGPSHLYTESPAELLLVVLGRLLSGEAPDLRDVVLLRTLLLQNADWYSPLDVNGRIKNANLDSDVARALMRQLGGAPEPSANRPVPRDVVLNGGGADDDQEFVQDLLLSTHAQQQQDVERRQARGCKTLRGALEYIMTTVDECPGGNKSALASLAPAAPTTGCGMRTVASFDLNHLDAFPMLAGGTADQDAVEPDESSFTAAAAAEEFVTCPLQQIPAGRREQSMSRGQQAQSQPLSARLGRLMRTTPVGGTTQTAPGTVASASAAVAAMGGIALSSRTSSQLIKGLTVATAATGVPSAPQVQVARDGTSPIGGARSGALLLTTFDSGPRFSGALRPQSPRAGSLKRTSLEGCQAEGSKSSYLRLFSPLAAAFSTPAPTSGCASSRKGSVGSAHEAAEAPADSARVELVLMAPPARPQAALLDEVELLLSSADELRYDTWALAAATGGRPLSAMGFYLMQREGLVARFGIQPLKLVRLLGALEAGYPADNPYHNATHAADVLRTLHVLLHEARLTTHYVEPLGLLAAYFAAIVHDHGHPGLTGDFLVATSHPLALRYNDRSPLESHHAASAFTLLAERPELDILAGLSREERAAFRKQVMEMVLATDMKQHFSILSHFTTATKLSGLRGSGGKPGGGGGTAAAAAGGAADPSVRSSTQHNSGGGNAILSGSYAVSVGNMLPGNNSAATGNHAVTGAHAISGPQSAAGAPVPADEADRALTLQVALKVADIGHLAGDLAVHKRWLGVLEEEFFRQGDTEKALGLPISPLFDRTKQGVSKSQVGFFDFVALPLVRAMADAFPGAQPLLHCFEANYRHWQEQQRAAESAVAD